MTSRRATPASAICTACLPASQRKIDRSFVRDPPGSADAQAIVAAVVRLSHAQGLKVVAEGVETVAQARILARLQCDELQGALFAKPMPEPELLAWLGQHGSTVSASEQVGQASHVAADEVALFEWSDLELART